MKKGLLGGALLTLLLGATTGCSQDNPANQNEKSTPATTAAVAAGSEAPITPELIRLSEFIKLDYKTTLANCKKGDQQAILEFLDFHRIVEEKSAVEHSLVCLDMIAAAGDDNVVNVCVGLKEKLKVLIRERLVAAQAKSTNPQLQKSMSEWAPKTWAALNNQVLADPAREAAEQQARLHGKPGAQSADQMEAQKAAKAGRVEAAPKPGKATPVDASKGGGN